jgi:hypothetical protein
VLRAHAGNATPRELAACMRTTEPHAEHLLALLSVSNRARIDMDADAELRYRVQDAAPVSKESVERAEEKTKR